MIISEQYIQYNDQKYYKVNVNFLLKLKELYFDTYLLISNNKLIKYTSSEFNNYDHIMKNRERKLRTLVDGKGVDRIFNNIKKVIEKNIIL